tara:strand:- start:457 stop:657 length:201 start_codon:yes stop_codon:yes gene_type:complete
MGIFIRNTHINCSACGYGPFSGRESSSKKKDGSIYTECRWVCPRCTRMARLDEKTIPAPKAVKKDD